MGKSQQVWKFSWNPSGYFIEGQEISTINFTLDTELVLPHTYFTAYKFIASYMDGTVKKILKCHEELKPDTDIFFSKKEIDLSTLAGKNVYSKIKFVSQKALNKTIFIDCVYLADALTFDTFRQDLHQEADVEHNSLLVKKLSSDTIESKAVYGDWGRVSEEGVSFTTGVESKYVSLEEEGIKVNESLPFFKIGQNDLNLVFNKESNTALIQVGNKRRGLLFRGPETKEEIPLYGIPVSSLDDSTKLTFVPWFTLDSENKGIRIGSINIDDNTIINGNSIELFKKEVKCTINLFDKPFIIYDKESGSLSIFQNLIKINSITRKVSINGLDISENLIVDIAKMKQDIAYLKSRITN